MSWSFCVDSHQLIAERASDLSGNESLYNLTWSALKKSKEGQSSSSPYQFLIFREAEVTTSHAVYHEDTHHLLISLMSELEAIALIDFLEFHSLKIDELEGPKSAVRSAFDHWEKGEGRSYQIVLTQGVYEITRVLIPDSRQGYMISALPEHRALLSQWLTSFSLEAFPHLSLQGEQIEGRTDRFLNEKRAYFWCSSENELVSMASVVRESPNTSSISAVYTPPNYRGQGYAGRLVAHLSQHALDSGKTACNLHTDMSNPISNKVYARIGYRLIGEAMRYTLISEATQTHV